MITIRTGAPGNGKSLVTQGYTVEEFIWNQRDIVTSTPVRVKPWVTGDGRAMIGLAAYLKRVMPNFELPEHKVIRPGLESFGHMLIVEDEAELGTLFMWRRHKDTGEWFKLDWSEAVQQFDPEQLAVTRGNLIITDEAWKCYNSRNWKDASKLTEFYGRQHRKFGDDWDMISHSHKDLDTQLNRMCQRWQVCVNHGLRQVSVFRQPAVFRIRTFYEAPASANAVCHKDETIRLNMLLAQTYDTSAGVAVGGGRAADVTRRKPGISWLWLLAAVVLFAVLIATAPIWMGKGVKHFSLGGMDKMEKNQRPTNSSAGATSSQSVRQEATRQGSVAPSVAATPPLYLVGMSPCFRAGRLVPGVLWLAFSDGNSLDTDSPRIGKVFANGVFLDRQFVPWSPKGQPATNSNATVPFRDSGS